MELPTNVDVDVNQGQSTEEMDANSADYHSDSYSHSEKIVDLAKICKRSTPPRTVRPRSRRPAGNKSGCGEVDKDPTRKDGSSSPLGKHPRNDEIPKPFTNSGDHDDARIRSHDLVSEHNRDSLSPIPTKMLMDDLYSSLRQSVNAARFLKGELAKACETEDNLRAELDKCKSDLEAEKLKKLKWVKEYLAVIKKYEKEKSSGEEFHASAQGKAFIESLRKDAVKNFCESPDFEVKVDQRADQRAAKNYAPIVRECRRQLRETGLVTEKVVMMIKPHIPEVALPEEFIERYLLQFVEKNVNEDVGSSVAPT